MYLWVQIIEATLSELTALNLSLLTEPEDRQDPRQLFYVRILIAYFRQDAKELNRIILESQDFLKDHPDLHSLALMRESMRSGKPEALAASTIPVLAENADAIMQGEYYFLQAHSAQVLKNYRNAEQFFIKASAFYDQARAYKKALRATFSAVASYSCLRPEARLFGEYRNLYKRGLDIKDFQSAGTALLNISREFQILESVDLALDYINQAIDLFEAHNFGSREHGLALVHRAHLLFQSQRDIEATKNLQVAVTMTHSEVQSSVDTLSKKYGVSLHTQASELLLPTWKERAADRPILKGLGKLESRLIEELSKGPATKFELIEELYSENIEFEFREGRFKNLISRLRKRFPGLVVFGNECYSIPDPNQVLLKEQRKIL